MLKISLVMLVALFTFSFAQTKTLSISADKRHIVHQDGTPFFWLGDTAWELFHRTTREEADLYLNNRAQKGFTVIQAVVLAELDGLNTGNAYGHRPLINNDPTQPNEKYFEHVDYIVNKAQELGIFIGMLPTWGDKWNKKWGAGPEVFTLENAYNYGKFLGARYQWKPIIWILGGDRTIDTDEQMAVIRELARGLREGDGGAHLITFHPQGGTSSSAWLQQEEWLDINMLQSGHGEINNPNYLALEKDFNLLPIKPCLDGEPNYEDHPINWNAGNGWFGDFDSRRAGYWAMLQGTCGHTYGNHNIWQMWLPGRIPISQARTPWTQALDYPGAFEAGYMRFAFESRPWQLLVSSQQVLANAPNAAGKQCRAAVASDGSFLMVYTPYGSNFSINTEKLTGAAYKGWWFNPRQGTAVSLGKIEKAQVISFDPPADEGRGNDWLLILDDAAKKYENPAKQ
jgi:hypothetical protein